LINQCIT